MINNCADFENGEVLLLNKPLYWTSFDLVRKLKSELRYHCGLKNIKIGHAGTLDPMATGLMIICTGKATKRISEFSNLSKEYVAKVRFGSTTPSFDLESEPDNYYPVEHINIDLINLKLKDFLGEQMQEPPLFSAKFIDGKRAYEFARRKVEKSLNEVKVTFYELELLSFDNNDATIRVLCSKGTYIRAFARDIGKALNSGAHLISLVRTGIGDYNLEKAVTTEEFKFLLQNLKQNAKSNV